MATRSPDLVGRDRLLGRLVGLVDRALDGQRVTVLVSGQAGDDVSLLAAIAPFFGEPSAPEPSDRTRLRHRYTAETRRACLSLLRGQLEVAGGLIESAALLGERIREPDAGNVRMSQRLELVRAGGQPDELRAFASEAVAHWTGAPVHANAVAARFSARAGDLGEARRHVGIVVDLGSWQVDRSYLWWSVFVRELAHVAALLAGELDDLGGSRRLLDRALVTYQRLGATGWLVEVRALLDPAPALLPGSASMRRRGSVWHIAFAGRQATVAHRKGPPTARRPRRGGGRGRRPQRR
ncbi:MAG: hypothetical protein ACRDV9_11405 [Acidimicrobiia bacterium]